MWASKQVTNIIGANTNQALYNKDQEPVCPSCGVEDETCRHVLFCREKVRVKALNCTIGILDGWMKKVGTLGPFEAVSGSVQEKKRRRYDGACCVREELKIL